MDEKKVREAIGRLQVRINAKREMIKHNKAFFQKQDNSYLESDIEVCGNIFDNPELLEVE